MPSDDEKKIVEVPAKDKGGKTNVSANGAKEAKIKKPHKSLAWFFGVLILILISITFILPTTVFTSTNANQPVFGKYNGKKIRLEADSYFYYQIQNYANYYAQQYNGSVPESAWATIYYQAFQSALVHEAVDEMAKGAKIIASKKAVTEGVIDSGYWNNEEGVFDEARYKSATNSEKAEITNKVKASLPDSMVLTDIQSAKISEKEAAFISEISNDARSFDYLVVGPNSYGDAEATVYANNNPEPFMQVVLSAVSYETETDANDMLTALTSGTKTFEEAVETSIDGYKSKNGVMGTVYKYLLDSLLSSSGVEGASDTVFSTKAGEFVGPYKTSAGYTIFRVDEEPKMADLADSTVLSNVKSYIAQNDSAIMTPYLAEVAKEAYTLAQSDIDEAIAKYSLGYYSVDDVAQNPGDSGLVYSFNAADSAGYLTTASSDSEYLQKLFSAEFGTVLEPQLVNGSYIITIPQESTNTEDDANSYVSYMKQMIPTMYNYYVSQFVLQDLQNAILASDKVENNFFNVFYSKMLGSN